MFGAGGISLPQLLIVLVLALLFFGGRGKISAMMGDLASGMKSFRKGLKDEDEEDDATAKSAKSIDSKDAINVTPSKDKSEA